MSSKDIIHWLIEKISLEVLQFIRNNESSFDDRWVPATYIKKNLALNFVAVPKENSQHSQTGWFFGVIARLLEDQDKIEYNKIDGRAYCRRIIKTEQI